MKFEQLITPSAGMVVAWVLLLAFLVQAFYYFYFFLRVARFKKQNHSAETSPPVTVIICARNEDDNLTKYLPLVLAQDYPDFEVVVVNDCSFDLTADVLEEFSKKNPRLRVVTIKEDEYYRHGKKIAVMMGIKGAKYEHLVFTDADCRPSSDKWLRNMAVHFSESTEIILGYGPYEKGKGLLNKIIRFDTFFIALQYFSYSLAKMTYMGVGRNLAYKKNLFYKMKGFASHYHIPSGDDDLFVNEAATSSNTKVEIDKESFCYSAAKKTFREWWFQKKRHLETGGRYRWGSRFLLGFYFFSLFIFFGCIITLLILQFMPLVAAGFFGGRLLLQMLIFNSSMKRLDERDLLALTPLLEIFFLFFYPVIFISRMRKRPVRWTN